MIFVVTCCTVNAQELAEVEKLLDQKIEVDDHGVQINTEFEVDLPDGEAAYNLANSHPGIIKVTKR